MHKTGVKISLWCAAFGGASEILAKHPVVYQKRAKNTVLNRNKQKQTVAPVNRKQRSEFGKTES